MPSDERDRQFERALQRHLRADAGDAACPDAETLAAYHERTLSVEELTKWKGHISGCARCQETLALLEETNAVALHEWEEKDVTLQEAAAMSAAAPVPRMPSAVNVGLSAGEAASIQESPPVNQLRKVGRPKAWRWVVPAGALAAGLLVFVATKEYKSRMNATLPAMQVAENRETAAPPAMEMPPAPVPAPAERHDEMQMEKKSQPELATKGRDTGAYGKVGSLGARAGTVAPIAPKSEIENYSALSDENQNADKLDSAEVNSKGIEVEPRARQAAPRQSAAIISGNANAPAPAAPPPAVAKSAGTGGAVGGATSAAKQTEDLAKKEQPVGSVTETVEVQAAPAPGTSAQLSMNYAQLRRIASANPHFVLTPDGKRAWRVGAAGVIESSSDAGVNWKAQKSEINVDLTAGSAPSDRVCWVVGKAGTILLTTDGGKHWKLIASPLAEDLGGVHAVDAKRASIWNVANQKSFETADGGMTWTPTANE
ncbi:MAG TPA: YCF48-related protein [Candidatus Acidoferrum sp.]|jgi:hypothetical protein